MQPANANAAPKNYVKLSYLVSLLFVVIGTAIGLFIPSLNELILWLVSALYGGYTAANLLKWYWWRFNGYGYFFGMLAGILTAIPMMFTSVSPLYAFPVLFAFCLLTCIVASLLTPPDEMAVLKEFYCKTRPWGFWSPVLLELQKDNPAIQPNRDFGRDMANVCVGIVWHTSLTAAPIFMVIQQWQAFAGAMLVATLTSIFLKYYWWDQLRDHPDDRPVVVAASGEIVTHK